MQDTRNSSRNGHRLDDRLLDQPDIGELHNDKHALDNVGLALKIHILETRHFPEKNTATNISDRLLNTPINFGVWPKDAKGRIPKSEEALRCDKLAYFGMEPPLERPVLTSDCGSDVPAGAEKNRLWDCC